jgi:hypothetical protein
MLFNSIDFAIFLPIVFILYWFVVHKNLKLQNLLIVGASYQWSVEVLRPFCSPEAEINNFGPDLLD